MERLKCKGIVIPIKEQGEMFSLESMNEEERKKLEEYFNNKAIMSFIDSLSDSEANVTVTITKNEAV